MRVAFIVDYYPSLDSGVQYGGAEISIKLLIKSLQKKGIETGIIAPSAGFWDKRGKLLPEWFSGSPFWIVFSAIAIYLQLKKYKPNIIHVQGKNTLLGASLANIILKKPFIVTVRDYYLLCNLGMCLLNGEQICTPIHYFCKDIPEFVKNYTKKKWTNYLFAYVIGLYQILLRTIYHNVLKSADKIVCISNAQKKIYCNAGFSNTTVIYNIADIKISEESRIKQAVFNGRYTKGKGKELLEVIIPRFLKNNPGWKFLIVGRGETKIIHRNLQKLGQVPWQQMRRIVAQSSFVVMPSVWPEPFGRSALDAISVGTPVIASNRGGLPEIVENNKYGLVVSPEVKDLMSAIRIGVRTYPRWERHIREDGAKLAKKFATDPIESHIGLYKLMLHQ